MSITNEKQRVKQAIRDKKIKDVTTLKIFLMVEELKDKIDTDIPAINNLLERVRGEDGKDGESIKGENGHTPTKKELLDIIKPLIPTPISGKDAKSPVIDTDRIALEASKMAFKALLPKIPTLSQIEKDLPILGFSVRDSLELLQDEERIDISAIKGMEFFQKKTDHLLLGGYGGMNLHVAGSKVGAVKTVNFTGANVSYSKVNGMDTVTFTTAVSGAKTIDLSSQLDGSETEFALGETIVSVVVVNLSGTLISSTLNATKDKITLGFAPESDESLTAVVLI